MSDKIRFKVKVRAIRAAESWINLRYKNIVEGSIKAVTVSEFQVLFDTEVKLDMEFKVILGDYVHKGKRSHIAKSYSMTIYVDEKGRVSRYDNPIVGKEGAL